MASLTAGGLVVEVAGDGFPVVMIHGLGGSSNSFEPQMQVLANYRVVRPDLPGSARSPLPDWPLSIAHFASAVVSVLDALRVTGAHFVGHSLGTLVCQRLAVDEPGRVASLTLLGALTEPSGAARAALIERAARARAEGMDGIADAIAAHTLAPSTLAAKPVAVAFVRESLMRQDPEAYARSCEALSQAQAVDWRKIKAPTLLIAGDADPVAPPSMAQMLADKIAGASLTVLASCGHWITIEKAQETSRKLSEFLQKNQR